MKPIYKHVVCADGVRLSVQASQYHYSTPREDEGPYSAVEVGYIQDEKDQVVAPPDTWRAHADGSEFPNSVYAYVPVEMVEELIASHGGSDCQRPSRSEA